MGAASPTTPVAGAWAAAVAAGPRLVAARDAIKSMCLGCRLPEILTLNFSSARTISETAGTIICYNRMMLTVHRPSIASNPATNSWPAVTIVSLRQRVSSDGGDGCVSSDRDDREMQMMAEMSDPPQSE